MREWKFYITGSIYADTLGETTADIEDAKAIGRCFVIKSNGNSAKMREALSDACYAMFNFLKTQNGGYGEMAKALDKAKAALAVPPRNCDVGTDEEQSRRYEELCDRHTCGSRCSASGCPMYEHDCSPFAWGQMPYEEGGTK